MISRPIKEGFRGVSRHWGMSLSSAIAVTITLIIISMFLMFSFNVQNFTKNIESSMQISAQVERDYEDREDEIEKAIREIEGVEDVQLYSKEEELKFYVDASSNENEQMRKIYEPFRNDNPFHDAFYITTTSGEMITSVAAEVEKISGIVEDGVSYGGQSTKLLVSAMDSIRRIGAIVVAALTLLAIFLIQNTIKLTISARQDEITIMRNVGATNHFIRAPFVIEGIITAMIGAVIPIVLTIYGYRMFYAWTGGMLISEMFRLVNPVPFSYELSGILLLIGIVVGFIGSWMSVTRYLRWKR